MKQKEKFGLLAALVVGMAYLLVKIGYFSVLNLDFLKAQRAELILLAQTYPVLSRLVFFALYVFLATFSVPGAVFMVLLSPSLFNIVQCYLLVIFAACTGATFSLLIARFFLKDWARKKFHKQLTKYHKQIVENEKSFLVTLRLIPVFPYSWVNIIYSVTPIKIKDYFWLTFLGMSPNIMVNLYAGLNLSKINKMSDLYSPQMILAFLLMAGLPLALSPISKKYLN